MPGFVGKQGVAVNRRRFRIEGRYSLNERLGGSRTYHDPFRAGRLKGSFFVPRVKNIAGLFPAAGNESAGNRSFSRWHNPCRKSSGPAFHQANSKRSRRNKLMVPANLRTAYQWNHRPQTPRRPPWFTQWPGGNRIPLTINIMHEWESQPEWKTARKKNAGADCVDYLSLTNRQYGANFGFQRLLDVFDRCGVKATVLCSGLMAEFFPDTLREAIQRGHEVASHHWDQ